MTTKETIIELIHKLPDDATLDDVMEELYVRRNIEQGLQELDDGRGIPHEDVKQRLAKWLE